MLLHGKGPGMGPQAGSIVLKERNLSSDCEGAQGTASQQRDRHRHTCQNVKLGIDLESAADQESSWPYLPRLPILAEQQP